MRIILLIFTILLSSLVQLNAQCSPNFIYTALGIPGVYPPSQLVDLSDGDVGYSYSDVLTIVTVEDTTMDVASLLPATVVVAMNLAGISTIMNVDVNYSTYDLSGLPNGMSYQCSDINCQYAPSIDGCMLIDGTPTEGGSFIVNVNQTLNIQIPSITTLFSGMAVDLPSISVAEYNLFIDGTTNIVENQSLEMFFPNPTVNTTSIELDNLSNIEVYNILGEKVFSEKNIKGKYILSKEGLGKGFFNVLVKSKQKINTYKLIIK